MDTIRYELKTLNRQFQLASKNRTACSNNLVALLEQSYPGVRSLFNSPVRSDGSQKWVDFVDTFWHVDCVAKLSLNAFTERYRKWCKQHGYNFSERKAAEIHEKAKGLFPLVPKSDVTKLMVLQLQPADDPVYQFLDKKRSEGKPYYVYMTAGGTKFLRIYYGRVRDCLKAKGLWDRPILESGASG